MKYVAILLTAVAVLVPASRAESVEASLRENGAANEQIQRELSEYKKHLEFYIDASEGSEVFNVDEHCDPDAYCVGTIITFKNGLFFDKHLKHPAGTNVGTCIVVAEYPAENKHDPPIQQAYCTWSIFVDHEGEITVQGTGTVGSLDGDEFLVTAASGSFKGYEGSIFSTPIDDTFLIYRLSQKQDSSAPISLKESIPLGNLRPEGITKGPKSTVFVSQITYGGVSSVNIDTGKAHQIVPKSEFLARGALAIGYTGDAFIVPGGGPVPFGFNQTAVYVYDASTGHDIATCFPLAGDEGFMNDIAIVDGKAYITDSGTPNLMVLDVDSAVKKGKCHVSAIELPNEFFDIDFPGANGIAAYGDGLLIATTSTGAAYFLNLKDNSVSEVIAPGDAMSSNGLLVIDDTLYITQLNNIISVWNLSGGTYGEAVKVIKKGELTSPLYRSSAVSTIIGDYLYTTNLRLDIGLPAPGEEDLSTFEEDFDIVVVPNILKN